MRNLETQSKVGASDTRNGTEFHSILPPIVRNQEAPTGFVETQEMHAAYNEGFGGGILVPSEARSRKNGEARLVGIRQSLDLLRAADDGAPVDKLFGE